MMGRHHSIAVQGALIIFALIVSLGCLSAWPFIDSISLRAELEDRVSTETKLAAKWQKLSAEDVPTNIPSSVFNREVFLREGQTFLSQTMRREIGAFRELSELPLNNDDLRAGKWRLEFDGTPEQLAGVLEGLTERPDVYIDSYQIRARDAQRLNVGLSVILLWSEEVQVLDRFVLPSEMAAFRMRNPFDPERNPVSTEQAFQDASEKKPLEFFITGMRTERGEWIASLQKGDDGFPVTIRAGDQLDDLTVLSIDQSSVNLVDQQGREIELPAPF